MVNKTSPSESEKMDSSSTEPVKVSLVSSHEESSSVPPSATITKPTIALQEETISQPDPESTHSRSNKETVTEKIPQFQPTPVQDKPEEKPDDWDDDDPPTEPPAAISQQPNPAVVITPGPPPVKNIYYGPDYGDDDDDSDPLGLSTTKKNNPIRQP
jgi:hypothetical protein